MGRKPRVHTEVFDAATGDEMTLKELAERTGININTIYSRYDKGRRGSELTEIPSNRTKYKISDGRIVVDKHGSSIRSLAKSLHANPVTFYNRFHYSHITEVYRLVDPINLHSIKNNIGRDLAAGKTMTEIAEKYSVSPETVQAFINKSKKKNKKSTSKYNRGRYVTIDGKDYTINQLSKWQHLSAQTLNNRYDRGIRGEELLEIRKHPDNRQGLKVWIDGEELTLREVAEKYKISQTCIVARYKNGYRGKDLITKEYNKAMAARVSMVIVNKEPYTLNQLHIMQPAISVEELFNDYCEGICGNDLVKKYKIKID